MLYAGNEYNIINQLYFSKKKVSLNLRWAGLIAFVPSYCSFAFPWPQQAVGRICLNSGLSGGPRRGSSDLPPVSSRQHPKFWLSSGRAKNWPGQRDSGGRTRARQTTYRECLDRLRVFTVTHPAGSSGQDLVQRSWPPLASPHSRSPVFCARLDV